MNLYKTFTKISIPLSVIEATDSALIPMNADGGISVLRLPFIFRRIVGDALSFLACNYDTALKVVL